MVRPFQQVPIYLSIFPLFLFFSIASAQSSIKPSVLEIVIPHGSLNVKGASNQQVRYEISGEQDSLIAMLTGTPNNQLFIKPESLPSTSIQLHVPKRQDLFIQSDKAAVTISDIESNIEGEVKNGPISISNTKGDLSLFTHNGDVTIRQGTLTGTIGTKKGNVLIEDNKGIINAFSQDGSVITSYTLNFFSGSVSQSSFELSLMKSDLQIASIPNGAILSVGTGNIDIGSASGSVSIQVKEGNINLSSINGSLNASTDKGNIELFLSNPTSLHEKVNLINNKGNVILHVPTELNAILYIEQEANDTNMDSYQISSEIPLGNVDKQIITNEQGKILAYHTSAHHQLGNEALIVNIRVTNGTVLIKKLP